MRSRFEQDPNAPYGSCHDCPATFVDRAAMDEHLHATFEASGRTKGHRGNPSNPTRPERIKRAVQGEADDALDNALTEFVDGVYDLHRREGIPVAELTAAVRDVFAEADWAEAWGESLDEDDEDDEPEERPDGNMCQRCRRPSCQPIARDHRKNRSQGGLTVVENLQLLGLPCHEWKTEHPAEANEEGWGVPGWAEPADYPARRWIRGIGGVLRPAWVLYEAAADWGDGPGYVEITDAEAAERRAGLREVA